MKKEIVQLFGSDSHIRNIAIIMARVLAAKPHIAAMWNG